MFEGDALGRAIDLGDEPFRVVGVVQNVKHRALELDFDNEIYFPMAQLWDFNTVDMVVRTPLPPASIAGPVGAAVRQIEPQMPTEDFRSLESVVEASVSPRRFTLQLLVAFAASALLLAAIGIYGVLSYSVTERVPEIGIRMALGERAERVRGSVVGRTALLTGIGVVIGMAAAVAGSGLLGSLLYGVEPTDPATFAGMIALVMTVAVLSGLVPAIRASRTDPADALRSGD